MAVDFADQGEAQVEDSQPQESTSSKTSDQSSSVHIDLSNEKLGKTLRSEESTSEAIVIVADHGEGQQFPEREVTQDPVSSNMSDSTSFSDLLSVLDVNPAMLTKLTLNR